MNQEDDPRSKILARRAAFVAAALASVCATYAHAQAGPDADPEIDAGSEDGALREDVGYPDICLQPDCEVVGDGACGDAYPQVCLQPPIDEFRSSARSCACSNVGR